MNLQEQLQGIAEKLSQLDDNNRGDLAEISRLTTMKNELLAQQALEERVQVQEVKVASIVLPYDLNELFGDENANDIVIELIRDMQRQGYAEHNQEVELMITEHKAQVSDLKTKNDSLNVLLDSANNSIDVLSDELNDAHGDINRLQNERDDALSKRDAAVAKAEGLELLLSEKEEHINKLREEIAIGAKAAVNVTSIAGTDKLAQLIEASKQAKVKSALDIALENATPFRGKVQSGVQLDAPEVTPFPFVNQTSDPGYQLVTGPASNVSEDDTEVTPSEEEVYSGRAVDQGSTSENGQTLEEAFRRIEALEAKLGA